MRATISPSQPLKSPFLESVRQTIRRQHLSYSTEKQYLQYVKDFILFHNKRHPNEMGAAEIGAYINHLALDRHVAASTQNTALCALLFLYRQVLHVNLPDIEHIDWAKKSEHVPEVFTPNEAMRVLWHLTGTPRLVASLLYGCGLRVNEALSSRVKDIDFGYKQITVHEGKGAKDRRVMLPQSLIEPLQKQIETAKTIQAQDADKGLGVSMPDALERKYPNTVQELLGHKNLRSTMIYTHVLNKGPLAVRSPLDA